MLSIEMIDPNILLIWVLQLGSALNGKGLQFRYFHVLKRAVSIFGIRTKAFYRVFCVFHFEGQGNIKRKRFQRKCPRVVLERGSSNCPLYLTRTSYWIRHTLPRETAAGYEMRYCLNLLNCLLTLESTFEDHLNPVS